MNKVNRQQQLQLEQGAVFSARFGSSRLLAIQRGHVWITQEGRSEDFWLNAGDAILLQAGQLVVIEAALDSDLALENQAGLNLRSWCRMRIAALLRLFARSGKTALKQRSLS